MRASLLPTRRGAAAFLILLVAGALSAAIAQEADSTWDDLGLDPEGFKYDEETFGHVSTGWFPQPYTAYTLSYSGPFGDTYDFANNIRPQGLRPTTAPFSWHNPFDGDERKILQPNSDEEEDDGYPATSYDDYTLTFLYNLPLPAVLRFSGAVQVSQGMLFSNDTSRSYLGLSGVRQPLKEVGVAYLNQYSIAGSAGIDIPVYGAFIKNEALTLSSYYYIFGGYTAAYAVSSKGTQYSQIANAKDQIRYGNGADTVTLINKQRFDDLNRLRTSIDLGIGWNVMASDFAAFGAELFVSVPQSSLLRDVAWKQYFIGLRLSLGWHWTGEGKKKKP
jgi:hypothetical protein